LFNNFFFHFLVVGTLKSELFDDETEESKSIDSPLDGFFF